MLMISISTEERRVCQAKKNPFNCCLSRVEDFDVNPTAKTTHLCRGDCVVPRPSENVRPWLQGSCPVDVEVSFEKAVLNFFGFSLAKWWVVY